jgi:hypothetical protein
MLWARVRTLDAWISYARPDTGSVVESVTCPGCQKAIRIPNDVLGQTARCPFCKCHFRAPIQTPEGLTDPVLLKRNPFARSRTFGPGALLLFVGMVAILTNIVEQAKMYADPEGFAKRTREDFAEMALRGNAPQLEEYGEITVKWLPVARWGFAGLSLLTAAAGIAMLRQRRHGLAMIGSVAAMFNVANCCCVLGFPAGAWSLFVLMNPEVRAQFSGPAPPANLVT